MMLIFLCLTYSGASLVAQIVKNLLQCMRPGFRLSYFFNDPADVGNLISGSSAFSETTLNIWRFMVHVLLKPGLENFEYYFTSV